MPNIFFLVSTFFIVSLSQFLIKLGLNEINSQDTKEIILKALSSFKVILGFAGLAVGLFMMILSLKKNDLITYTLISSVSYVFNIGFSYFFLHEQIALNHILGILFICLGIYLIK